MNFVFDDGGRADAGYQGKARDCCCRAISIATGHPYKEVYKVINKFAEEETRERKSSARTGVYKDTASKVLAYYGWTWIPTMKFGQGCKVHLRAEELPKGRIICRLSKHFVAVIDGEIHDTYDCSRNGTRCVYGYWIKK